MLGSIGGFFRRLEAWVFAGFAAIPALLLTAYFYLTDRENFIAGKEYTNWWLLPYVILCTGIQLFLIALIFVHLFGG